MKHVKLCFVLFVQWDKIVQIQTTETEETLFQKQMIIVKKCCYFTETCSFMHGKKTISEKLLYPNVEIPMQLSTVHNIRYLHKSWYPELLVGSYAGNKYTKEINKYIFWKGHCSWIYDIVKELFLEWL